MRVLSIVHHGTEDGGVFDESVVEHGHVLEHWLVSNGDAVPSAGTHDAVLVFGGAMHPDQDHAHPWLGTEVDFLRETLAAGIPVLGVCLGAQLVARAAGASVGPAPASEVGWHEIELTAAGRDDPVLGVLPERIDAFQWHHYTFGLPDGASELAVSASCRQAFALGERVWGIQFHAEVTREMIVSWADDGKAELPVSHAELVAQTDGLIARWNDAGRRLCGAFLDSAV
jgi:GMP synthase-like glutamine amidotransferase